MKVPCTMNELGDRMEDREQSKGKDKSWQNTDTISHALSEGHTIKSTTH